MDGFDDEKVHEGQSLVLGGVQVMSSPGLLDPESLTIGVDLSPSCVEPVLFVSKQ